MSSEIMGMGLALLSRRLPFDLYLRDARAGVVEDHQRYANNAQMLFPGSRQKTVNNPR
jgi:hypothetical protein